eukprot:symbB.v1.2.013303.t1/scaffold937.1/size150259/9
MEKERRILVGALISVSGILVVAYLRRKCGPKQGQRNLQEPPTCPGELPWLGHALAYRHDPRNFMLGHAGLGLFRLNLAGLRMTVVAGREEMAQVVNAPESILSSKEATADFGFAWTLGQLNVFTGTDFHRRILKQRGFSTSADELSMKEAVAEAISAAFSKERIIITDFLKTMRRIMLHAVVTHLLGTQLLKAYHDQGSDFLDDFMHLQDCIEDATAKGVALPRLLSWFLIWLPVFRLRKRVQAKLDRALNVWPASAKKGVWLQAATSDVGRPANEHAELIIGLLFAAHKNPAIGAAQTLLLLLEHPKELEKAVIGDRVFSEFVMRSIKETLRLTAHTIGAIRKVVSSDFYIKSHGSMYVVPHGQYVVVSHLLPNLDPSDFPSPDSFQPDRFAENSFDDFSFTTFSQGLHRCPGRFYALDLMKLVVCELLATFQLSLPRPDLLGLLDFTRATLAQRAGKCEVEIRPRLQMLEVMQC